LPVMGSLRIMEAVPVCSSCRRLEGDGNVTGEQHCSHTPTRQLQTLNPLPSQSIAHVCRGERTRSLHPVRCTRQPHPRLHAPAIKQLLALVITALAGVSAAVGPRHWHISGAHCGRVAGGAVAQADAPSVAALRVVNKRFFGCKIGLAFRTSASTTFMQASVEAWGLPIWR
jgi:hypothetical protein